MSDDQKRRLEKIKAELAEAGRELHTNADPYAACVRAIDAMLLLTGYLERL